MTVSGVHHCPRGMLHPGFSRLHSNGYSQYYQHSPDSSYLLGLSPAAEQGKRSQIPPGASAGSPPPLSGIEPLIIALFPL